MILNGSHDIRDKTVTMNSVFTRFMFFMCLISCERVQQSEKKIIAQLNPVTVELRYKEGARDRQNLLAVTRFCHIKVLFHINYFTITLIYTKDFVIQMLVISRFHCNMGTQGTVESLCTDRVSMFKSKVHLHFKTKYWSSPTYTKPFFCGLCQWTQVHKSLICT